MVAPNAASAEFDNSIPVRNLTGSAPMVVTETSVFFPQPANGKVRVCVSFRNVTAKPAAEIEFTFRFDDMLHSPLREAILHRTGSFGPGILIEGKMSALGGSPDSFNNCVLVDGVVTAGRVVVQRFDFFGISLRVELHPLALRDFAPQQAERKRQYREAG